MDYFSESHLVIPTALVCQAQKVIEDTLFSCENRTRNGLAPKSGTFVVRDTRVEFKLFSARFRAIFVIIVSRIEPYHWEGREILSTMDYSHAHFGRRTTSIVEQERRLGNRARFELTLTV